jgi:hypothetical protein
MYMRNTPPPGPRPHTRVWTRHQAPRRRAAGFTLMETALALIIVGTGVLASMQLFSACNNESSAAINATAARMLAENIRETMSNLAFADPVSGTAKWGPEDGEALASYDDIDDFDGKPDATGKYVGEKFNPPIDGMRAKIPSMAKYRQWVTVNPVNPTDPSGNSNEAAPTLPKGTYTGAVRVRVRVQYRPVPNVDPDLGWVDLYTTSWVRANN